MIRALALLLLLTGCAHTAATPATASGPEAVCERESWDDPQVKLLMNRQEGNRWLAWNDPNALTNARDRAKRACLIRLGAVPAGGGVERVQPLDSSYHGLF